MNNKNIALISPNQNAYSETFIQQHRNSIEGNVVFYFNGSIPKENDVEGKLLNRFQSYFYKLLRKLNLTKLSVDEIALIQSFKRQRIQIVIAEYGTTAVAVCDVCRFLNLPLIPIFHGYDASIKNILENYKTRYQTLFKYSKKVIAVSNKIAETLNELGCEKNKIIVTPCAPDNLFFEITPIFKKPLFIGVGRFVDKKAPYYTILAFNKILAEFPNAELVMAGDGPLINICENLITYLNISNNVKLVGVVNSKDLTNYFKEALAFVQHSITSKNGDMEGTPVAILEASAAGLPIISTFHAGIPDVIFDLETGFLVQEHDVNEMSEKMKILLKDYAKAQQMGVNGKTHILNNFSKTNHINILNGVIDDMLY